MIDINIDKILEREANKYAKFIFEGEFHPSYSESFKQNVAKGAYEDFISGANGKSVDIKKTLAMIEENQSILEMLKIHDGSERLMLPIRFRINTLADILDKLVAEIGHE